MIRNLSLAMAIAVSTFGLGLAAPTTALAAATCDTGSTGTMSGTFTELIVPDGAYCDFDGGTITGNVSVGINSTLDIDESGTTIRGSLTANQPQQLVIVKTEIRGSVKVTGTQDVNLGGYATVFCDSTIWGSVSIVDWNNREGFIAFGDSKDVHPAFDDEPSDLSFPKGLWTCGGNEVRGSVVLRNLDPELDVDNNNIRGSLSLIDNFNDDKSDLDVSGNIIRANFMCSQNGYNDDNEVTVESLNTFRGSSNCDQSFD